MLDSLLAHRRVKNVSVSRACSLVECPIAVVTTARPSCCWKRRCSSSTKFATARLVSRTAST